MSKNMEQKTTIRPMIIRLKIVIGMKSLSGWIRHLQIKLGFLVFPDILSKFLNHLSITEINFILYIC